MLGSEDSTTDAISEHSESFYEPGHITTVVDQITCLVSQHESVIGHHTSSTIVFSGKLNRPEPSEWNIIDLLITLKSLLNLNSLNSNEIKTDIFTSLSTNHTDMKLKKLCSQILDSFSNNTAVNDREPSVADKHIMISYFYSDMKLCCSIKAELEKLKFKVWMDERNLNERKAGIKLDTMADGVENCLCMLMCVSDQYKDDTQGRAEAEYAFLLGKPIIPLIMQRDYKPSGWLGK